ncbi:MAG: hypothetical protein CM1200mP29_03670 [Verrucomicrobiota bacterium]|nr:MAG: hypothetical protein CM1200mP29_03670 [Verrucomicrobiota bacterium]
MISRGIRPRTSSPSLSPTRPRAKMKERVRSLVPKRRLSMRMAKRRSRRSALPLAVRSLLRRHITKLGYKKNFVIYDEAEQLGVVRRILSHISLGSKKPDPYAVLSLISRWRNTKSNELNAEDQDLAALAKHLISTYSKCLRPATLSISTT